MLRGLLGGYARGRRQTSAATLYLDFLAGLNDSRITYSGGANGTRVNSAGVIVAATTPRFDYNPVTLAARGLLVEEARTNLLLRSGDLSNAAWTSFGALTVTSGAADPAGGTAGVTLDDTDAGNFSARYQDVAVANDSAQRTLTFFLKEGTAAESTIQIIYGGGTPLFYNAVVTWATKTVAPGASAGPTDVSIEPWYDGYYRVSVRGANNSTGNTNIRAGVYPAGTSNVAATGTCIAWGAQNELGSFATSYIPTTTAAVTRTADSAVMTGTNFSSWYNQSEGTFVVSGDLAFPANGGSQFLTRASDNSYDNFVVLSSNATGFGAFNTASSGVFNGSAPTNVAIVANTVFKIAGAYATNDLAAAMNGNAPGTDSSATIPLTLTQLDIGADHGGFNRIGSGHIATLQYFPRRVANTQLQAMTA